MAEKRRLLRGALGIDEYRQIPAQAHPAHRLEEEGAMSAEQVLHIVLRARDQNVDAGLVHQPIETIGVEGDFWGHTGLLDDIEHDRNSWCAGRRNPRRGNAGTRAALRSRFGRSDPRPYTKAAALRHALRHSVRQAGGSSGSAFGSAAAIRCPRAVADRSTGPRPASARWRKGAADRPARPRRARTIDRWCAPIRPPDRTR